MRHLYCVDMGFLIVFDSLFDFYDSLSDGFDECLIETKIQ
jgi:hypothetical protein